MELSPGLHRIECPIGPRYVAIYAIVGSKYTLLVDTGFDDSIRTTVVNYFKSNKLSLDKVGYVPNVKIHYETRTNFVTYNQ